jgi:hypothetical protein
MPILVFFFAATWFIQGAIAAHLSGLMRAAAKDKRHESLFCCTPRHSDFCCPAVRGIRGLPRILNSELCKEHDHGRFDESQ